MIMGGLKAVPFNDRTLNNDPPSPPSETQTFVREPGRTADPGFVSTHTLSFNPT